MSSSNVTKSGTGLQKLKLALEKIRKSEIYVGIPAEKTQRRGDGINNASLLFLHSQGSPLQNIPARPVLEPAIERDKELIAPEMSAAAKALLDRDPLAAKTHMKLAGTIAANAAKRYVMSGENLAPNTPSTVAAKGSERPLVDTAQMVRAITSVIKED